MRKKDEEHSTKLMRYALNILLGGAAALVICLLLLFFASICISQGLLKEQMRDQIIVASCVLGSFLGAMFAVCRCGSRGLIIGILSGVTFFLLLLTAGVLFFDSPTPGEGGIGLLCGALCGSAVAGLLGGRSRKKHHSKQKHTVK